MVKGGKKGDKRAKDLPAIRIATINLHKRLHGV
jgi:hypothetical protein